MHIYMPLESACCTLPKPPTPVPGAVYLPLTILLVYVWYVKYTSIVCMVYEVYQYEEGHLDY